MDFRKMPTKLHSKRELKLGGEMLRLYVAIILILMAKVASAATCTALSRTDAAPNSILTSTKYNGDINPLISAHNSFDAGCIAAGSIDDILSFDSSVFKVILTTPKSGCDVTISDVATLSVDKCRIMVNGNNLVTTVATTKTWSGPGDAGELASTQYYLYAKNQSTFSLLISTTAPDSDGYDASNNRALAVFWNDSSSNITAVGNYLINGQFNPIAEVRLDTPNGFGSTNTSIRRWTNTTEKKGSGITYADSAGNGMTLTINEKGTYCASYSDTRSGGASTVGISKNSNQLTTSISAITTLHRMAITNGATGFDAQSSACFKANSGDIIRSHGSGSETGNAAEHQFIITKVSN
jgi:hypothetical protein